jgi:hypothetical protein
MEIKAFGDKGFMLEKTIKVVSLFKIIFPKNMMDEVLPGQLFSNINSLSNFKNAKFILVEL